MGRKSKQKQQRKVDRPAAKPTPSTPQVSSGWTTASPPSARGVKRPLWHSAAVIAAFALLFMVNAVTAYMQKSNTVDEPIHLLGGYSYLKWGDFRINPEHPPLAKMWAALPLLTLNSPLAPKDLNDPQPKYFSGTIVARDVQGYFPRVPVDRIFYYAKFQMVLLGIALGIAIFAWAKELFGFEAAAAALFIYGLDPNILANSQLVHTDVLFAAFSFATVYFLWRTFRYVTWSNIGLFCLCFGLAAATKHSFIALVPIVAALGAVQIFSSTAIPSAIGSRRPLADQRAKALTILAILAAAALSAYILLWASYGFRFNAGPRGAPVAPMAMPETPWVRDFMTMLFDFRIFPHAWVDGQIWNMIHIHRTSYLLGQLSDNGFLSFFPVAIAVKTPVATLILIAAGLYFIARRRIDRRTAFFLLLPAAVYLLFAVAARLNIGHRHILQIYPFLFLLAGAAAAKLWSGARPGKAAAALLGVWLVGAAVFIHPNHLAYFNELAGGPKNGYRVLVDSNLDWGQDLKALQAFLDEKRIGKIYLSYFGTGDPCLYHIDFTHVPGIPPRPQACAGGKPDGKAPEFFVISATTRFLTRNYFEWLASYQPIAQIGYSLFVYDLRGNRDAHRQLGIVYLKASELDDARREFALAGEPLNDKQLTRIDLGDKPGPYLNLGALFYDKGMLDEAIAFFERAVSLDPKDSDAHTNLGGVYLSKNRIDRAVEEFEAALKINPKNAEAHNNIGTAYLRKGRPEIAYTHYSDAVRLKPEYKDAQENLKVAEQARAAQQPKR
jgi:predicted negative regulator of RcsB-dependent stress response/predicted membrane-bound dolichyl-phosphate-mannose-protein mannosyltransferase